MSDQIQADYEQLGQVASKFASQAQTTRDLTRKVQAAFQKLEQGGWMGRGAEAFVKEMNAVVLPGLKRMESALQTGSTVSKEISQKMRSAEDEACAPFKKSDLN
jgi:WXG100 family type VII secretion target